MAHLSTARNIISSCQISSHLIKIIATFIVIINSVIFNRRRRHSPSHQGVSGFKGGISGSDQMRYSARPGKSLMVWPHSNHHIHCFNAAGILFAYLDIRTAANLSEIAWCGRAGLSIMDVQREKSPAVIQSVIVEQFSKALQLNREVCHRRCQREIYHGCVHTAVKSGPNLTFCDIYLMVS